ncbi:MAG: DUF3566 domain-containing protein [Actinomycetota bacterium]|nr:DUF3566 domain-containing protein [Actinomycetota bacterium]
MASTKGDPDNWSARARRPGSDEPATRNLESTGPLFDPLNAAFAPPATGEAETAAGSSDDTVVRGSRTEFDEESIYARPQRRTPPPSRQRPRRVRQVRRVRRTLRHVDPLSVLKVSLMFYGCFLLLWLVFVAILYWVVQAAGVFESVEEILQTATLVDGPWTVSLAFVEKWAFFIGLTISIVMSLVNLFLAFLYNVVADVIGGIDMTFVERD